MLDKADQAFIWKDLDGFFKPFTSHPYTHMYIDNMWNTIKNFTNRLINDHVPSKMASTKNTNPWAQGLDTIQETTAETQREVRQAHDAYMDEIIRESPGWLHSYSQTGSSTMMQLPILKETST